jgi:hypothetical protein
MFQYAKYEWSPKFACPPLVRTLAKHDPEVVSCQKAPSLSIDRILTEAQDVLVVVR